ncbi:hypothetical protein RUND412_002703 [Rhizina undulata]
MSPRSARIRAERLEAAADIPFGNRSRPPQSLEERWKSYLAKSNADNPSPPTRAKLDAFGKAAADRAAYRRRPPQSLEERAKSLLAKISPPRPVEVSDGNADDPSAPTRAKLDAIRKAAGDGVGYRSRPPQSEGKEGSDSERTDSERTDSERTDSERTDSERTDSERSEPRYELEDDPYSERGSSEIETEEEYSERGSPEIETEEEYNERGSPEIETEEECNERGSPEIETEEEYNERGSPEIEPEEENSERGSPEIEPEEGYSTQEIPSQYISQPRYQPVRDDYLRDYPPAPANSFGGFQPPSQCINQPRYQPVRDDYLRDYPPTPANSFDGFQPQYAFDPRATYGHRQIYQKFDSTQPNLTYSAGGIPQFPTGSFASMPATQNFFHDYTQPRRDIESDFFHEDPDPLDFVASDSRSGVTFTHPPDVRQGSRRSSERDSSYVDELGNRWRSHNYLYENPPDVRQGNRRRSPRDTSYVDEQGNRWQIDSWSAPDPRPDVRQGNRRQIDSWYAPDPQPDVRQGKRRRIESDFFREDSDESRPDI